MNTAQWVQTITSTLAVAGTVLVAVYSMKAANRREDRQRLYDTNARMELQRNEAAVREEQARRSADDRNEHRLLEAIIAFSGAVKNQTRVCARMAASFGIFRYSREPLDPIEGETLLAMYEDERSIQMDRLLLFGGRDLQQRARAWQKAVWSATAIKNGLEAVSAERLSEIMAESASCRDAFYNHARLLIRIEGEVDPTPPHDLDTPGVLPGDSDRPPELFPNS